MGCVGWGTLGGLWSSEGLEGVRIPKTTNGELCGQKLVLSRMAGWGGGIS